MEQAAPELEKRLTELQSQINRLSLSLHLWQERQDRLFEQRLTDWNVVEARVQKDASARLHQLQRTIEEEWTALRSEGPGDQVHQLELNLGEKLSELSDQVRSAVVEMRSLSAERLQTALQPATPSWPLDDVVRLHNQLREVNEGNGQATETGLARLQLPAAPPEIAARLETLEKALADGQSEIRQAAARSERAGHLSWAVVALVAVAVGAAGIFVGRLQRQVNVESARVTQAEHQAELATTTATQQLTSVREESAKLIAEARDAAVRAQTTTDVLASPDLVRFNLVGRGGLYSAQVLWSRSRGLVFNGTRLPPPPENSTYQIWLFPAQGRPVTGGTFAPDSSGRFSMATADPPTKVLTGVTVTVEPVGGVPQPMGRPFLFPPQPPAEPQ